MDRKNPTEPPPQRGPDDAGEATPRDAFDLWLRRSLHRLYDGVAQEPVPPELLRLIEADRARREE